jgi:uncharacterized membrane protein YphA (DoxX/SURF4 family)
MKLFIQIIRVIVGVLFIFSGLVKANDPAGLSYKMHEFFEAWGIQSLNSWALALSVLMIAFEIIAGLALLLGWYKKINLYLLLVLIIFFTFLTGYALLAKNSDGSLKFKACGCFGDCIPLKPIQSFYKDVVLLVLILLLVWKQKFIQPIFNKKITLVIMAIGIVFSFGLQKYTLDHLPLKDCLSFKVGNNILAKKQFIPDSVVTTYYFKKAGKEYSFSPPNYPEWYLNEDSTYVEDSSKTSINIIREGNKSDIIRDFNLISQTGTDTTIALLSKKGKIVLFIITDVAEKGIYQWEEKFKLLVASHFVNEDNDTSVSKGAQGLMNVFAGKKYPMYVITNRVDQARIRFANYGIAQSHILFCDEKPLLAAARTRPCIMVLEEGVILKKITINDIKKLIK